MNDFAPGAVLVHRLSGRVQWGPSGPLTNGAMMTLWYHVGTLVVVATACDSSLARPEDGTTWPEPYGPMGGP